MRVFITGYNCSGMTAAARRVSQEFDLPATSLDSIYYSCEATETLRDEGERDELLRQVAEQDSWIIEGRFLSWTGLARERADLIVFMKAGRVRMIWRLLGRFFSQEEQEPIRNLVAYARSIVTYKRKWYPLLVAAVHGMERKLSRATNSEQAVLAVKEALVRG